MNQLSSVNIAALSILTSTLKNQPKVDAGVFPVDFTVRIRGEVRKGEDYKQKVVQSVCPWTLLGIALSKVNRETAQAIVREGIKAHASGQDPKTDTYKQYAEEQMALLAKSSEKTCSGKTTGNVSYTLIP